MSNQALIAPQFVAAGPTTLVFKEKKYNVNEYINDADGNLMFKTKRHTLEDASGRKIGIFVDLNLSLYILPGRHEQQQEVQSQSEVSEKMR